MSGGNCDPAQCAAHAEVPGDLQSPEQRGERRIIREGEGNVAYLQISYHVPAADADDFFPLRVMDAALTGPARM